MESSFISKLLTNLVDIALTSSTSEGESRANLSSSYMIKPTTDAMWSIKHSWRKLQKAWNSFISFPPQIHQNCNSYVSNFFATQHDISVNLDLKKKLQLTLTPACRTFLPTVMTQTNSVHNNNSSKNKHSF
jgi:hypothetical protein